MTYQPREGDHVRVVLEGRVMESEPDRTEFRMGTSGYSSNWVSLLGEHVKSVERIEPPEDYQPSDVVIDADGETYMRGIGAWRDFSGVSYSDNYPTRPLTLIARDGKPVTP